MTYKPWGHLLAELLAIQNNVAEPIDGDKDLCVLHHKNGELRTLSESFLG